jgi:cobalt-zinc-cadmium efflux system membrane fusion protein
MTNLPRYWFQTVLLFLLGLATWLASTLVHGKVDTNSREQASNSRGESAKSYNTVSLSDEQARTVQIITAQTRECALQRESVGYIDFNQDKTVSVSPQWAGHITKVFVQANDQVHKGQPLLAIDSIDLIQAESTLISTAGLLQLTRRALERAHHMSESQVGTQKDWEQAQADQQTAEANYKSARDAVRIFGKSDADIDSIIANRKVDGELIIKSPIDGLITSRSASVGALIQPGQSPAPLVVSDVSSVWMVASVSEYDLPILRMGQSVSVSVSAYPEQVFKGEINSIGAASDPATHRIPVRSVIRDPQHQLRAQMLATFVLYAGHPTRTMALPLNAVIRESDGSMSVFVTKDGHRFEKRTVKIGSEQAGYYPIESGLSEGERVAGDSALFISNALALQSR